MRNISIIAACDIRGGFAKNKAIPWIDEDVGKLDLKHFQQITKGHACVMGVNTYNEIYKIRSQKTNSEITELLPNRHSYIVTSKPSKTYPGATTVASLREARQLYDFDEYNKPLFVIGGRRLFIESMAWADDIYLSIINKDYDCDTYFPVNPINKKFTIAEIDKNDNIIFLHYIRHNY